MRLGFVVNDVATELPAYTTTRLAFAATRAGHEVWVISVADLAQDSDGAVMAHASGPADKAYRSLKSFANDLIRGAGIQARIKVDDLDLMMLRNDPAADAIDRPWAQRAGVLFGQLAASRGVIVVNDPSHLANAIDKSYFQHFPEEVRPATMISRDADDIREFVKGHGGQAVLKPLQGSGGQGVFVVDGKGQQNLNQMIESIARDGFIVAQEYVPEAADGDIRLFVMNGSPLEVDGRYAAFRRRNDTDDPRSNMHAGGKAKSVRVTQDMLDLVDVVRPKLVSEGMFLVGLDIIGSVVMEVNVFSPGGLGSAGEIHKVDFAAAVIEALERKVRIRASYGAALDNTTLATL